MVRLFSLLTPARGFTLFISEVVLLFAAYVAAIYADPDIGDAFFFLQYEAGFFRVGIVVGVVLLGLFFRNLYGAVRIRSRLDLFQNLCMVFGAAFIAQGFISYIYRPWLAPRRVMLMGSLLAFAVIFCWRLLFNEAARAATPVRRVLFLGLSPTVVQLAAHFDLHPELGVTSVGYLDTTSDAPATSSELPRLGSVHDLDKVVDEQDANSIVIGKRHDIRPFWVGEFLTLRFGGLRIEEACAIYEQTFTRKCITEVWPARVVFGGALQPSSASLSFQSIYSPVLAFLALLIASPLLLFAAALVRFSSRGPVLERERRIGLHDQPFDKYRFRCRKDGILTRLRLCSLPSLFNVLAGQMAIVGPRAEQPFYSSHLSREIPFYCQRNRVKPGLTGWAQVHGSNQRNDMLQELEYDLYYVENVSPLLDSLILLLTLKSFVIR